MDEAFIGRNKKKKITKSQNCNHQVIRNCLGTILKTPNKQKQSKNKQMKQLKKTKQKSYLIIIETLFETIQLYNHCYKMINQNKPLKI